MLNNVDLFNWVNVFIITHLQAKDLKKCIYTYIYLKKLIIDFVNEMKNKLINQTGFNPSQAKIELLFTVSDKITSIKNLRLTKTIYIINYIK